MRESVTSLAVAGLILAVVLLMSSGRASGQPDAQPVPAVPVVVRQDVSAPRSADDPSKRTVAGTWRGTLAAAPRVGDGVEWAASWKPAEVTYATISATGVTVDVEATSVTFEMKAEMEKLGWAFEE